MATLKEQIARWNAGTLADALNPAAATPVDVPSPATAPTAAPKPNAPTEFALSKAAPAQRDAVDRDEYFAIKTMLHQKLLQRIDLTAVETMTSERLEARLRELANQLIDEEHLPINQQEHDKIIDDLQHEILGLGPLEPLLADPTISEIMVNGAKTVYVERRGQIVRADVRFNDDEHLLKIIDKIVSRVGRRIDEASPMADARLPDGSRVNAIIPPLALDGPTLCIRRFAVVPLQMADLLAKGALTRNMATLLAGMVKAKANIIVSGGTGSGKTTLLNILSSYIPDNERIITIEDTAELQLQQEHVVRLETRPPNIEEKGGISMRSLVKNSLRMRPDRIVVGEVRGGEVIDMLQAMNTGHKGSLTTIHANTPQDCLGRIENLVSLSGMTLPSKALRQQVVAAINVIVQVNRLSDGTRKIVKINEITGMEGDIITTQDIFTYEIESTAADGKVIGKFKPTGVRPIFSDQLQKAGITLDPAMFDPDREQE
jgi:pilus assembly protein CpaF